jgi:hypothetical protein
MPFSESTKSIIKKRANFTCCWCNDRLQKVEVHHIVPQEKNGSDTEDNGAPLCANCHTAYGDNPKYQKEIRARRDHWYETCQRRLEFAWSPNLHTPRLEISEYLEPSEEKTLLGTTVREGWASLQLRCQTENDGTSPLKISIGYHPELTSGYDFPRRLSIGIEMPFGLNLSLGVLATNNWDINGFMRTLRNAKDIWMLRSHPVHAGEENSGIQIRDYFTILRMDSGENRLIMSMFLPTEARIAIRARFTDPVAVALAEYLESKGFSKNGTD